MEFGKRNFGTKHTQRMMKKVKSKVAGSTYPLVPLSLYLLPIEQLFQPNDADHHCATCVFWLVVTVVGRNSQKKKHVPCYSMLRKTRTRDSKKIQ